jgi:hypothetical protein
MFEFGLQRLLGGIETFNRVRAARHRRKPSHRPRLSRAEKAR